MMLVSLIALASILGVVMKSRQQASASPSTTSSINEITSMVTLASPTVSTSTTISQSLSTAQGTVVATPSSNVIRNIAAVSYTSDFVNITKIYYSNNSGQLIEATTSNASLSTTPTWTKNMLNYTTNNGSAIAAAVSRPGLEPMVMIYPSFCISLSILYLGLIAHMFLGSYCRLCGLKQHIEQH